MFSLTRVNMHNSFSVFKNDAYHFQHLIYWFSLFGLSCYVNISNKIYSPEAIFPLNSTAAHEFLQATVSSSVFNNHYHPVHS